VRELDRAPAAAVVRRVTRLDLVLPVDCAAEHDPRRVIVVERDARVVIAEQRPARLRDRLRAPASPVPAAVAERVLRADERRVHDHRHPAAVLRDVHRPSPAARGRVRLHAVELREAQRQVRERADQASVRRTEATVLEPNEVQRALERRRVPVGERDQDRAVGRAGVLRVGPHPPRSAPVLEVGRRAAHERPRPGPVAPVGGRREVRRPARAAHEQVQPVTRHHRVRIGVAEPASGTQRDRARGPPAAAIGPRPLRHAVAHSTPAVARVEVAAVRRGERVQALAEENEAGIVVVVGLERLEQRPHPAATRLEVEVLDHGRPVGADAAGEDATLVRHRARIAEVRPRAGRDRVHAGGPVRLAGARQEREQRRIREQAQPHGRCAEGR
jgi:hypothetical protein